MNVKEEKICRICLRIAENDFKIVDGFTRNILEGLLLKMNLDISKDPIICKDCAEIAEKCYNFKSVCMDTENFLCSFITDNNVATLELKDVFMNAKDIETDDGNFICTFCSNSSTGSNSVLLETLMSDISFVKMLKLLMPRMDFNVIKNPLICTSCQQDLECYIKFVDNCLHVEDKITKYIQNEGTRSSAQVKLSEILCFKNIMDSDSVPIHMIKVEKYEFEDISEENFDIYDVGLIKTEEVIIKNEININEESACQTGFGMYKFNIPCEFKNEIGMAWKAIQNNSCEPTMPENRICSCDTVHHCCIKCESQSNVSSLETEMEKSNRTKYKSEMQEKYRCKEKYDASKNINSRNRKTLKTKNILEAEIFKCAMCTYQTKHKGHLKTHMLVHKDVTEVELYKCSMCTFGTKHKINLKNHMVVHKDITEVEMYKCSMCIYETKNKRSLKRHMLIHKDVTEVEMYKCSMCTFDTKHKVNLKRHMLIHNDITGVEMCKCSMCSFETKNKQNLKKHMLIHKDITEVEMYKCSMCAYETKNKQNLKRHVNSRRHYRGGNV